MPRETPEHYIHLAARERAMAEKARDMSARAAHTQMALRYERLAKGDGPVLGIVERG